MKLNNLQTLLAEKQRVKYLVKNQELDLKDRVSFFQSNYKGIIWSNINPFKENVTFNSIINLLAGDLLPLLGGLDGGKEYAAEGKLFSKGVRSALITIGVNLLKKLWKNKG